MWKNCKPSLNLLFSITVRERSGKGRGARSKEAAKILMI
jgi:hypothetical protein